MDNPEPPLESTGNPCCEVGIDWAKGTMLSWTAMFPYSDPNDRRAVRYCEYEGCRATLHPYHVAVYCSNECALADA